MNKHPEWLPQAVELLNTGMSKRAIARELDIGRTCCRQWLNRVEDGEIVLQDLINRSADEGVEVPDSVDTSEQFVSWVREEAKNLFNNKADVYKIETTENVGSNVTHLMIPDTQCKDGVDMTYLEVLGKYIVDKQPDVIVHIGDHADMPSLSSYDKGKRTAEGKRVQQDIEASIEGMNRLLKPLYDLQQSQLKEFGEVLYKPKMVLTLGNHEQRIERHVDANPELHGFLSYNNLRYSDMGWEVYDFLQPAIINGVSYVHYMANPMTGRPYSGQAMNILKNVGESFCMGHKQTLDIATRFLPSSGKQQWAIIAGAYYEHDEAYKGHQGNHHFRGIVVKHNVKDGSFNPMIISLDYLKDRYA